MQKITVPVKICRNSRSFGATVSHPRVSVDRVWAMSREREQMCSLSVQSRAAGDTGRALDRGRRGDPSRRLWTSYLSSDLRFFTVSAVRLCGSSPCLCPRENDSHSWVPHTKTADHTAGAEGPSLSLTEKSPAARATSHKEYLCKGWQPSLGQAFLE